MIVVINTKTDKKYHTKIKKKAAKFIGVNRNTITNWINKGEKTVVFNHLIIHLDAEEL